MDTTEALTKATIKVRNKTDGVAPPDTPPSDATIKKPEADDLMLNFFKMENKDVTWDSSKKMKEIKKYANDVSKKDGDIGIINVLRDIRFRMGAPDLGVSTLDSVYKYVKLRTEARQLEAKAKALEV